MAERYVREFDTKWLRGGAHADEPLVGSGDIQSLADLANSFEVVRTMRIAPNYKRRFASPSGGDNRTSSAAGAHHDAARRTTEKVDRNIVLV